MNSSAEASSSAAEASSSATANVPTKENSAPSITAVHTRKDLGEQLRKAGGNLLVVQFATEYAPYCAEMEPAVNMLASEHKDNVHFIKIDANEMDDVAKLFRVKLYPTHILIKNWRILARVEGVDGDKLKRLVKNLR